MTTALTAGADGDLSSGSYYLSGNVAYRGVAPLTVSGDVTLCLNGYELNLNGQCIYVGSGADLTLCDCGDGNSGVITGGLGYEDGFDTSGGGVYVENSGNFTMEGGIISGNSAYFGGGVYVSGGDSDTMGDGTFTLNGGTITGNDAITGGVVRVEDSGFIMKGSASITGNTAEAGGGVSVFNDGSFAMEGGTITGNKANLYGGGVDVYEYNGSFTLSGNPVIADNTKTDGATPSNVCLRQPDGSEQATITIGEEGVTKGTRVGVTLETSTGTVTRGWSEKMVGANPADYFFSDDDAYDILLDDSGEAALGLIMQYTVTFDANGGSYVSPQTVRSGSAVTEPDAPSRAGCCFAGWYLDGWRYDFSTPVERDITLVAGWSEIFSIPSHDITVDCGSHGDVKVWPESAPMTTTVTITVTPDKGYEVAEVIVTNRDDHALTVTPEGGRKYAFTMPNSDVTVAVTFRPVSGDCTAGGALTIAIPDGWVNPYSDVAANAWYYDAVDYASANGLMGGVDNDAFAPEGSMNRSMVWTVIACLAGQTIGGITWAQDAFAWAISKGFIDGRDGQLAPGAPLTRAEAATILARFHVLSK